MSTLERQISSLKQYLNDHESVSVPKYKRVYHRVKHFVNKQYNVHVKKQSTKKPTPYKDYATQ